MNKCAIQSLVICLFLSACASRGAGHRNVYPGQISALFPGRLTWRNSENVGCRTVGERARGAAEERSKRKRKEGGEGRKRSRGRSVRTTDTLLPWRLPQRALLLVCKTI